MIKKLFENPKNKTHYFDRNITDYFEFCRLVEHAATHLIKPNQTPVFLCIGSDRITGDCLGPLVGHKMKHLYPYQASIYGTLEQPVHAKNLHFILEHIYEQHEDPFLVVVDASLGVTDHIGCITLSQGGICPGKGVNKKLPFIGDVSITGIVNTCYGNSSLLLQNTRLHLVNELSEFIFMGLANGFSSHFMA